MQLSEELTALSDSLAKAGIEYALCGGLALAAHGHPRFTQDLDVLIREDDLPRVIELVSALGFSFETGWLNFRAGSPEEIRIYRLLKIEGTESLILDLIVVTPVLEPVWKDRNEIRTASGRLLTIVSRSGLIRMKELSGRTQDLADIEKLRSDNDTLPS